MTRILVLGGTRFAGRATVAALLESGQEVTVLSRRPELCPPGARAIGGERREGLAALRGETFDATIDFICFDGKGPGEVMAAVDTAHYLLVSSTWLCKLAPDMAADAPVPAEPWPGFAQLPAITRDYLAGKAAAEETLARLRMAGRHAISLRLPILMGEGDPTGRLDFYVDRILRGEPVIAVDGGANSAQIAWSGDVARILAAWAAAPSAFAASPIWEGLPDDGRTVAEWLALLAQLLDRPLTLAAAPASLLAEKLPAYLTEEPLWRERALARTGANLFGAAEVAPTPVARWLAEPALRSAARPTAVSPGAAEEAALIRELHPRCFA